MLWNSSCSVTSVWNNTPVTCNIWAGSSYLVVQNSFNYYKKTCKHSFLIYDLEVFRDHCSQDSESWITLTLWGENWKKKLICVLFSTCTGFVTRTKMEYDSICYCKKHKLAYLVALESNFNLSCNGRTEDHDNSFSWKLLTSLAFCKVNLKEQSDFWRGRSTNKVCIKDKEPQRSGKWA